ncbi:MAG: phosphodiester glycosidase family protein, partial [Clostridia bacterium]|nr:phosphodiester glycosidase family protein [Clostridia bacterium]
MRNSNLKRWIAAALMILTVVGMVPFGTFAASADFASSQLDIVIDKESTLAPGVTLNDYTVYDKNGDQVRMFVTKADMSVDTVKLFASYKDMDPTNYGMSKLTEQVATFNEKAAAGDPYYQGTVVAGINASYYNMTTGKPTGTFVMNGIDVTTESEGNNYGYFAVMKDGSVKIGNKGDYSKDKGNIQEAIGIYTMLIVDGQICSGLNTTQKYPRQTIGITADGDVIIMMADGNQAPKSIGLTVLEQAQVMLDLGCVWAGHLDGGGSGTYACKPEGEDDFVITNSPSDGSERSVSNGFIVVSTAAASYTFDHVAYEVENDYMTPDTTVKVDVAGVSATGNAADIPADITYVTTNGTYADGLFTAGDAIGEATITAMYNGKAAGTVTLNVVNPDAITFDQPEMVIPYGKTVSMAVTATYGVKEVAVKPADFQFTFGNTAAGTLDGFNFTACAEESGITGTTVEAKYAATGMRTTANVTFGKGSEVVYDFEDGTSVVVFDETPGTKYNYVWPETT